MLPTFSLNLEPQKEFTMIVLSLLEDKEHSSEELSLITEYAMKKAYHEINCSFKTFKYNQKWEGNQGVYKSEKQRNYMPDMVSLETNQAEVENKFYFQEGLYPLESETEYHLERVDDEWAVQYIMENYMKIWVEYGWNILRLLEVAIQKDEEALLKLKFLLQNILGKEGIEYYKELRYAIGLFILIPEINTILKKEKSSVLINRYNNIIQKTLELRYK